MYNLYIDLDNTLRETYVSPISKELVDILNILNTKMRITIVSDTWSNPSEIHSFLRMCGLHNYHLITPLVIYDISLTEEEKKNGYKIQDDCVYVFKFPYIDYELMKKIYELKKIRVIEFNNYEESYYVHNKLPSIKIPYVGKFLEIVDKDMQKQYRREGRDIDPLEIEHIGKESLVIGGIKGLMIGDARADMIFAEHNGLDFRHVNNPTDTFAILSTMI